MFKQFFNLKSNPFTKEINSRDLFLSSDTKEAESRLNYLKNNKGIGLLTGEPGIGKSTVLRKFAEGLNPSLYKPCYFALSTVTVMDFYVGLAQMLGEEPACRKVRLFTQIQNAILEMSSGHNITPVIILDEIHMASSSLLDELRIIFNFKMDSNNPYILILSGQPAIKSKLSYNFSAPLRQRICIKYLMQGFTRDEIKPYISSRMELAGGNPDLFTEDAYEPIFSISSGCARVINNLATHALMHAFSIKRNVVDSEIIYQAQKETEF